MDGIIRKIYQKENDTAYRRIVTEEKKKDEYHCKKRVCRGTKSRYRI